MAGASGWAAGMIGMAGLGLGAMVNVAELAEKACDRFGGGGGSVGAYCYPHDGVYTGARGYTEAGRPSQDAECLSAYPDFRLEIYKHEFTFRSDGREWRGKVSEDGRVRITCADIEPRTKYAASITGPISDARLYSGFCGNGYFRLTRAN